MDIPLYDSAGSRLDMRSSASIKRLLAVNSITVVRDRRGNVRRAFMRQADGKPACRPTAHMGQSYSLNELLATGNHAWKHKKLPKGKADMFIRAIFRRVQLDCITA